MPIVEIVCVCVCVCVCVRARAHARACVHVHLILQCQYLHWMLFHDENTEEHCNKNVCVACHH